MSFIHEDPQFGDLLRVVADKRRLALALVEKDYWVTHVLWALHEQGFDVWFILIHRHQVANLLARWLSASVEELEQALGLVH